MSVKSDFPPLFSPGFHPATIQELRCRCVTDFPLSTTRQRLMTTVENLCDRVAHAAIPCTLWIDGSFLTKKIDPSDVDIAVIIPAHICSAGTSGQSSLVKWVKSRESEEAGLDGFVITKHSESSPMAQLWKSNRDEFEQYFGTGHDNITPKGIVVITFRGGA